MSAPGKTGQIPKPEVAPGHRPKIIRRPSGSTADARQHGLCCHDDASLTLPGPGTGPGDFLRGDAMSNETDKVTLLHPMTELAYRLVPLARANADERLAARLTKWAGEIEWSYGGRATQAIALTRDAAKRLKVTG